MKKPIPLPAAARRSAPCLRRWETALLLALCVSLFAGMLVSREQQKLASGLIRLHVIAVSDSEDDQRTKLAVRDAVLSYLTPQLEAAGSPREAREILENALPALEKCARETADVPARATLGWENYPTRQYDGFALPAGRYLSLRVELGAAQGKNWWCVVYPPLCNAAVRDRETFSALLDGHSAALITETDSDGVVLKFRVLELLAALRERFGD